MSNLSIPLPFLSHFLLFFVNPTIQVSKELIYDFTPLSPCRSKKFETSKLLNTFCRYKSLKTILSTEKLKKKNRPLIITRALIKNAQQTRTCTLAPEKCFTLARKNRPRDTQRRASVIRNPGNASRTDKTEGTPTTTTTRKRREFPAKAHFEGAGISRAPKARCGKDDVDEEYFRVGALLARELSGSTLYFNNFVACNFGSDVM